MNRYFVPYQKAIYNEYMTGMEREVTQYNMEMNKLFIDETFEVKNGYWIIRKAINELQIDQHICMSYQPFFKYGIYGPLMREFREYLIGYFESQYSGYKWIDALINSDFFCFAVNNRSHCNHRHDLSIEQMSNDTKIYYKQELLSNNKQIIYFADRSVCGENNGGIKTCKCKIRRCIHNSIHKIWVKNLFNTFSNKYFIVYGNPAYLTFETHYYLMRNLYVLIGPHGASFALMILMKHPQKVFELVSKNSLHLAKMLQLIYYGFPVQNEFRKRIPRWQDYSRPIWFNVPMLIKRLRQFLELNDIDGNLTKSNLCDSARFASFC